jgi:Golgi phosphoprotein 3 (GPP34)
VSVHPADGVAIRVAALCLDPSGRLSDRLVCGPAIRGGLLLDLALAGRVEQTEDSIVIDPEPIGLEPADRLLAAIAVEPERSLNGWLDERRVGPREVAEAAVAAGRWTERRGMLGFARRYVDDEPARTAADRSRDPSGEPAGWTSADACVCAVGAAARLLDPSFDTTPSPAVLAATGTADWLCTAVVEHLQVLSARWTTEAAGLGPF